MTDSTHQFDQPLYDATKPIACTIEAAQVADHLAVVERLRANLESIERTPHGVLLALPNTVENVADARQFAADEKACCEFWGFDVVEQPDLRLRWDGPPDLADYMDKLIDYFEGRAPIGSLFGSL